MPPLHAGHPPVDGATPLFDSAGLRAADAWASGEKDIASLLLMERAGAEAARATLARFPDSGRAVVLVGPGNNGGDGAVVGRLLREAGWDVELVSPDGDGPRTPDAAAMARAAKGWGLVFRPFDAAAAPPRSGVVVDALLGTGQNGPLREPIRAMCAWANSGSAPIVALDVPTGISSDDGRADPDAIGADMTVTFLADTVGLRVDPGRTHAGEVVVAPIGIPSDYPSQPAAWAFGARCVRGVPAKGADKYAAGAVLVVAGSDGMSGAARLASTASLRAGAGLVLVAVPAAVADLVAGGRPEVMVHRLPTGAAHLHPRDVDGILTQSGRFAALAVGPGLGRDPETGVAVRDLLARSPLPAVVDADALWHLVDHLEVVRARNAPTVLTPHTGEAARLLNTPRAEVDAGRLHSARALSAASEAVVVLKGPGTLVAAPGWPLLVSVPGGPELATAGSGDVLTGIVAAFLAKGMEPPAAAAAAVAVHGAAAALAGRGDGTLAGDVADYIPNAVAGGRA